MFEGDSELLADFVVESREGLVAIESELLEMEANGAEIDLDQVNRVFRAIHSIKGASGFLGLTSIGELSHCMEHVLSQIRTQALVPTAPIVDQLLKSADLLKRLIENVYTSNSADVSDHVQQLQSIDQNYQGAVQQADPQTNAESEPTVVAPQFQIDAATVDQVRATGDNVYQLQFDLLKDREARNPVELLKRLRDIGTLMDGYLDTANWSGEGSESLTWNVLQSSALDKGLVSQFLSLPAERVLDYQHSHTQQALHHTDEATTTKAGHSVTSASQNVSTAQTNAPSSVPAEPVKTQFKPDQTPLTQPSAEPAVEQVAPTASASVDTPGEKKGATAEASIRVSVSVLDRLMNLAGELVLGRNQLLQALQNVDRRTLETTCSRIDMVTCELQDAIMQTRMQPIGTVFTKFTRIVRDLGQQLGKKCELIIEGKDVDLDRTIIEAIGDPLTHLVRNSMDHGLEKPDVRARAGKNPVGTVRLSARHQEGKVLLSISDDGAGIDAARIRRKAVEKGLLTAEAAQNLSDREAVQLIFAPGFSTAEQVTAVSGRGVGMDVVKTNIERLGGSVEIETAVGVGTTMLVRLPLTLAIIPSLIASCEGQRFAIPQVSILELVRIRVEEYAERIGHVNRTEVLRLRGQLLPLVRLNSIIRGESNSTAPDEPEVTHVVVVESGRNRFGLVVDRLHDSEEIVVKPLGRHLKHLSFLAGATVLGDGRVAMILDAGGLAVRAGLRSTGSGTVGAIQTQNKQTQAEQIPTLLFTNHPSEWFGVPMSLVARIERIRAEQIDTVGSRQVLQYRGGTLSLLSLEDCITAKPRQPEDRLYVIVFNHGGREVGLIAPEVRDIRECTSELDNVTFMEPGVMGSSIVEGNTVRFLDVFDLGNTQHTIGRNRQSAETMTDSVTQSAHTPVILYAEDSGFFRNKVLKFLREQGYEVIACEDGLEAWEQINSIGDRVDLILTDIEMPRMTGFELCQCIRRDGRWPDVPIVAVTSLAADADRVHGIQCGVTEYMVKLDRDQLLNTVTRLLGQPALS